MREPSSPRCFARKNRDLRLRQVFEDYFRHIVKRAWRIIFENENGVVGADLFHFRAQGRGDVARRFVGDNGDPFVGLEAQAIAYGIACTRH